MPSNRGQASRDLSTGAAVRAAVFGGATLSHQRRTERPFRHRICDKTRPRCVWAETCPPAATAHPGRLFLTGRTRLGRSSLGQLGGAGQTAAGPAWSAGEGLDGLAGLAARGPTDRGCRRYEEQTSSETHGRDITSSIFPPLFSSLFPPRGPGCPRCAGGGNRHSERLAEGKSIWMIPASPSSCYAGRGGKTRLKGFSTSSRRGTFCLAHQENFSHCADKCGRKKGRPPSEAKGGST